MVLVYELWPYREPVIVAWEEEVTVPFVLCPFKICEISKSR